MVDIQMGVARDEQVHKTIAVVVTPGCTRHKSAAVYTSFVGYIFEFAVSQAVIQSAAVKACHVEVQLAVVIVVRYCNAHPPTSTIQTRGFRDVLERAVRFLMVEGHKGVAAGVKPF